MIRRVLLFLCFLGILAVLGMNFRHIMSFGQAREVAQSAKKAIAAQNWEDAVRAYERGHRQYADNLEIYRRLGWLYDRAGQTERALKTYHAILEKEPGDPETLIGLTSIMRRDPKQLDDAIKALKAGLEIHPNRADLLYMLGSLYQDQGDNAETLGLQAEKADSAKTDRQWFYQQARYYYAASLKQNPRQFQAYFNLGVVQQNLRNLQPAAKAYCQALIINPDSVEAHYNLGITLSMLEYQEQAYRQMDRAIQILTEAGDIPTAQRLALKVQNVKNRVYARGRGGNHSGLSVEPDPPFLNPGCLRHPDQKSNPAESQDR